MPSNALPSCLPGKQLTTTFFERRASAYQVGVTGEAAFGDDP